MGFPPERQSIGICVLLAATGGILEVFATVVVAVPDAREKQGQLVTRAKYTRALVINIVLQILASVVGNTMSTWFGPVSIVGPVFFASQMVANMIVFGCLTGLEIFTKEMRVGTWVIMVGTVIIIFIGPQTQENQDVNELMSKWYSILWSSILVSGMAVTSVFMALMKLEPHRYKSEYKRAAILLAARGCALSVNFTVSKPFAMKPGFPMVMLWVVMKILSGAVYAIAIIIQCTAVTQSTFVPINTTVTLLLNAITGIIIWEDWRTVVSWVGYVGAFTLLVLGIYLILGDVDFRLLTSENPRYGIAGKFKLQRMKAKRDLLKDLSGKKLGASNDESEGDGANEGQDLESVRDTNGAISNEKEEVKGEEKDEVNGEDFVLEESDVPSEEPQPKQKPNNMKSAPPIFHGMPAEEQEPKPKPQIMQSAPPFFFRMAARTESRKEAWSSLFGAGEDFLADRGGPQRQSIFFHRRVIISTE